MLGCMVGLRWERHIEVLGEPQEVPRCFSAAPCRLSGARTRAWGRKRVKGSCLGSPPMGAGPDPSTLCRQVPEWTKCTSREKRKEKVEKPFYSDSEGESGPTESADSGEDPVAR